MPTYAIGDVQGCFQGLMDLLAAIDYQPTKDHLWFCGDLINRGPDSVETLAWIAEQKNVHVVLGNHDLHALALAHKAFPENKHHTLDALMAHPKRDNLLEWLRHQPLLHVDHKNKVCMAHAGIYPQWSISEAISYADEIKAILQSPDFIPLLQGMYGNTPNRWKQTLGGIDRQRFIINSFTRMRFIDATCALDFNYDKAIGSQPDHLMPWFVYPHQREDYLLCFGHWAALNGEINQPFLQGLDGGYVWGRQMIAFDIEQRKRYVVNASPVAN